MAKSNMAQLQARLNVVEAQWMTADQTILEARAILVAALEIRESDEQSALLMIEGATRILQGYEG